MAPVPVKPGKILIQTKVNKYVYRYWCSKDESDNFCRKKFGDAL